jgi:hypothetical protein
VVPRRIAAVAVLIPFAGLLGAARQPAGLKATARETPKSGGVVLKPGDIAPDFSLVGSDGKTYRLADYRGVRPVVLAWFPKAYHTL